jgi:hypothetical protein
MNDIVNVLAQKFNLSPETAQQSVDFVVAQVKGKLPENHRNTSTACSPVARRRKAFSRRSRACLARGSRLDYVRCAVAAARLARGSSGLRRSRINTTAVSLI